MAEPVREPSSISERPNKLCRLIDRQIKKWATKFFSGLGYDVEFKITYKGKGRLTPAGPLPRTTREYDVFFSYNSKSWPIVWELAELLRARGLRVWLAKRELPPGRPRQEALEEIIKVTPSACVLLGKEGFGPWQSLEMRSLLTEFVNRKLPVIPVLLPGALEDLLPPFLKELTWIDLRRGLTETEEGEEGIDRLVWGITGKRQSDASQPVVR
jgi:hypothetical protein